ncbi:transcriptional regulator, partial [Candidatus Epulonipiscium fishelsonii]
IFTKMGREIAVAVKEGGADPLLNNKLADIIRKAKSNNMPNDTIQRSIKKASGDSNSVNYEYITYEGYGPNGIAVIVDALTDNKNRTAANVRAAFTKGNGNMGTTGCVSFMFDKKGQILVDQEATNFDEDEFMLFAIDSGADDFESEDEMYVITTSPEAFSDVCSKIEAAGIEIVDAKITMIPQTEATLEEINFKAWDKMMALLEEDEDVQEVYHNCENATV